jgi:hypothetical protein
MTALVSGELPQSVPWHELRDHVQGLHSATITDFVTDDITEAWIDFNYRGYHFSINNQFGEYWFFVDDPKCPDETLKAVLSHCKCLLEEPPAGLES